MKYRKKPVVIEAEQWFPGKQVDGVKEIEKPDCPFAEHIGVIHTLEGSMIASPGDWVITGVKQEKYPCKDEIFRATYEPVDGATF